MSNLIIPAGDTYTLDGVTYTALEDSQLNLDDDGKVSGIASGKVTATVTRRSNPIVTFDASDGAIDFSATGDGKVISVTTAPTFEFISGEFTFKGRSIAISAGANLAVISERGGYTMRNEIYYEYGEGATFTFTDTAFIAEGGRSRVAYIFTNGEDVRKLEMNAYGKTVTTYAERGFTLAKGSNMALTIGGYTLTSTALQDAGVNFELTANGLTLVPNARGGVLNMALSRGDTEIISGELTCTSGSITLGYDNAVTFEKGTSFNLKQGDYVLTATTTDEATIGISLQGNRLVFTPGQNDGGLNLLLMRGGTPVFGGELNVTNGSITFNPNTQKFSFSNGTEISIAIGGSNPQEFGFKVVGGNASCKVESDGAGNFVITPDKGDGSLDITLKRGGATVFYNNISVSGGSITIGNMGQIIGLTKGTTVNVTLGNYTIAATATDDASFLLGIANDGTISITPDKNDGALDIAIKRGNTMIFSNTVSVDGTIRFNPNTQAITLTDGTKISLTFGAYELIATANGNATSALTLTGNGIVINPNTGDGSLDLTLKSADGSTNANIEVLSGSFILGDGGLLTVTKDTELQIDFGGGYIVNLKATDDAGGQLSFTDGITFAPNSDDGGLELSVTRDGVTRSASLNVTGSITYKLDGSISLANGTVVDLTWADGVNLKMTSHGSKGFIAIDPQRGLNITSDDESLDILLTTPTGMQTDLSGIKGTLWYNSGSVYFEADSKMSATSTLGGQPILMTLETIGGTGHISFVENGTVYTADTGAMKITWARDGKESSFTVNSGAIHIGHGVFEIAEGSDFYSDIKDLVPALYITTTDAGNYTLNGMNVTTSADNIAVTLPDDYSVMFAADAPVKISTVEGGRLFLPALDESDGIIQVSTKNYGNFEVTNGSITFDNVTRKYSCAAGTTITFTQGGQVITLTADKNISATYKVEEDVYYFMLDGGATADISISLGGQKIFAGDLEMGGVLSYRPSTGTFGLTGSNSSHGDGTNTYINLKLDNGYSLRMATDDTTIVFIPTLVDGNFAINFPNTAKHAMKFTLSKDGQELFSNHIVVDGTLGFDNTTQELYMTKGTTATITNGDTEISIKATDDARTGISFADGKILLTPKDGDGSIDFAIKRGGEITFASNLQISGGSIFIDNATQSIGLTKGTTLTLTQGNNVVTVTALDDAGGQLSFIDGGIRFAPNTGDGKLELNFVTAGRKVTLDVTGAIVYGGDGKISLEDGTVVDLTWTDGINLKLKSRGSTGSIFLDPDKGIRITSADKNLDVIVTTSDGYTTEIKSIEGYVWYKAGTVTLDAGTVITGQNVVEGRTVGIKFEAIDGDASLHFANDGITYSAGKGKNRVTYTLGDAESSFTLNKGSVLIQNRVFHIAEGSDIATDFKDFVAAQYFMTSEAGTYTLNGQKITTTTANIPIVATDDMMTFNLNGDKISVDNMTFTGRGDVIITADGVTVGAGVEVAGLDNSKSFVLTEAGNVTVDNRIFELTEDVPTGISVTGDKYGFEFARTLTKESEERLGYYNSPDIGKIFREGFTARGDDGYRVQTDLLGLQQIIGISAPVTVNASAALDDEEIYSVFDIVTETDGTFKIGNNSYTISGDSSVTITSRFDNGNASVRAVNGLSGTISGDFTPHAVSLDGGDPIIIHGDRAIDIVNGAGGAEIFNLSNKATLEALGGVSKVHTDTAGKFQFGNTEEDSLGVTIRGDDNVTFEFDSDQELTGINDLEGDIIFSAMSDKLIVNGTGVTIDGNISSVGAYDGLLYLHDASDGTAINTSAVDKTWAQMRGASMALNANNLTLTEDDDGIWIRNKEVFGLDEGASLKVSEAGSYVVNGEELTASANDIIVGLGEAGAYVYDANDPLITRKSSSADIIDWFKPENVTVVGAAGGGVHNISMSGGELAVVEKTAARVNISAGDDTVVSQGKNVHVSLTGGNTWLFATGGKMTLEGYDAATGTGFGTNYLDIAAAVDGGAIKFSDGELSIGSAVVDLGKRNEIVDFYDRSGALKAAGFASHNGELDAGNSTQDLILVGDTFSTLRGGAGDDTIFAAEGSFVDGGAGENLIKLPETRNGYAGATINIINGRNTIENFSAGFDATNDRIENSSKYWDNVFDGKNVSINADNGTTILKDIGNGEAFVHFQESANGYNYKVALAQKNSVIAAGDELANVYIGEKSGVDFTGVEKPLFADLRNNNGQDIYFYGINNVTAGDGSATLIGTTNDETLTAGTARNSIWGGAGNDLLRGNTSDDKGGSTEFFFLAGDGKDTISDFEFYDGSNLMTADKINVGTNEVTSVNVNGAGDVLLQINGGDDWLTLEDAQGKLFQINNLTAKVDTTALAYDDKANCFVATGLDATLTVDESAEIWLSDGQTGLHGKYYLGEIKTLDATNSTGENILAGNNLDNTIIAGSGKTSLWGGDLGDDLLIGGAGKDNFFYALGNGNDTISGTTDGDVINLAGVTLEQITSTEIAQGSVTINFADGGRLNVNGSAAVEFALGGEIYLADQTSNTWHKK